jgi:hypothetical protein
MTAAIVGLGLAALSAVCFLTFALWPRSSPRGQLEVVRGSEDDPPAAVLGKAAAPAPEPIASAVVDNTPPPTGDTPLVRLTEMLRLRRRHGRYDWRRQDLRATGGLAPWHCVTCGQTGYGSEGERPTSCKRALTAGRL